MQGTRQTLSVLYSQIVKQTPLLLPLLPGDRIQTPINTMRGIHQLTPNLHNKHQIFSVIEAETSLESGEMHPCDSDFPPTHRYTETPRRSMDRNIELSQLPFSNSTPHTHYPTTTKYLFLQNYIQEDAWDSLNVTNTTSHPQ